MFVAGGEPLAPATDPLGEALVEADIDGLADALAAALIDGLVDALGEA